MPPSHHFANHFAHRLAARRRMVPLLAVLLLLSACNAPGAEFTPASAPAPEMRIDWLHGFYAVNSYPQLDYAGQMDAVSVGWAQLEYTDGILSVNSAWTNGNDWVKPEGAELVTDYLAERSIPCNLNVYATASTFTSAIEDGPRAELVPALVAAAAPYSGLTIDFEGLRVSARADFSAFMTDLRAALPAAQSLYVCVPPDDWFDGYDFHALGELCDRVILMAHDYQWTSIPEDYLGGDNTYSPLSPLDRVADALREITDPETGVADVSKVALQIAFNSCGFHVDEEGKLLDSTLYHPAPATIAKRLRQPDSVRVWDEWSGNPILWYTAEDGARYKLWYEDEQSVEEKLLLCARFGVTGVSIWRLGSIPDFGDPGELATYNVWELLTRP